MAATDERPTPRRRAARAAADEHVDPVASSPALRPPAPERRSPTAPASGTTSAEPPKRGVRGAPEATVQLNSRVALDVVQLIDQAVEDTGWTKRTVIENAIRRAYSAS